MGCLLSLLSRNNRPRRNEYRDIQKAPNQEAIDLGVPGEDEVLAAIGDDDDDLKMNDPQVDKYLQKIQTV